MYKLKKIHYPYLHCFPQWYNRKSPISYYMENILQLFVPLSGRLQNEDMCIYIVIREQEIFKRQYMQNIQ